jgi:iron complex outermembrane recepter protein
MQSNEPGGVASTARVCRTAAAAERKRALDRRSLAVPGRPGDVSDGTHSDGQQLQQSYISPKTGHKVVACAENRRSSVLVGKMFSAAFLAGTLLGPLTMAGKAQETTPDLGNLSLDSLASMEITSVSRKEQTLTEAAGAIFVITSEDIRRSGMSNIAELLRTVPGVDVAEIDANKWSITTRGFGERYPDKTLVLLDGRTLYSPLTSGVTWDVQETMLEDIERIEVIRGPGATLWGANAVNGVVNIITKTAKETQGTLISGAVAIQGRNSGATRYGGTLGSTGHYRIYGKYFDRDGSPTPSGGQAPDGWHDLHSGFRADWKVSGDTTTTVQGDLYRGRVGTTVPGLLSLSPPLTGLFIDKAITTGGNLLGSWTRTSDQLDSMVQAYFDLANRNESGVLAEFRRTFDVEVLERYHGANRHELIFGGDFRDNADRTVGSLNISFNPTSRDTQLYGAFCQDEIALLPNRLKLTLGTKIEHNFYSGIALQPDVRLIWISTERTATWMAISRASESSSRTDSDVRTNDNVSLAADGTIVLASTFGTEHLPPENVLAYELGSRWQPSSKLSFDLAGFYNHYSNRHTNEPGTPFFEDSPAPRHLVMPNYTASNISGETHGLELLAKTHPTNIWELSASYTLFEIHLHQSAASLDFDTAPESEGSSPTQEFQIHSLLNLPHKLEFDSALFHVGQLVGPGIKAYTRLDLRVGWRPTPAFELSGGGRNLLQAQHYEFGSGELVQAEPVGRSAYLKANWRFW